MYRKIFTNWCQKIQKDVDNVRFHVYIERVNKKWKEEVPTSRPIDDVDGQMSQDEFFETVGALCAHFLFKNYLRRWLLSESMTNHKRTKIW